MSIEYRIGVDIGGTFTDFTLLGSGGELWLWKEDSTPQDPLAAIERGLAALAAQRGVGLEDLLSATRLFVHGTTIATNLLIQRDGPRTALLCTEGFRDLLHFRDGFKSERFDIHFPHPEPLVPRWLRIGVAERVGPGGEVVRPLDEAAVVAACARMRDAQIEAVAIALLWSIANPAHERRVAEIVTAELPDAHVVCSSDVLSELREWERTSATVLSAYVRPRIASYLTRLESTLKAARLPAAPLVMQVNGGCGQVADILRRPVSVLSSGPTAAPAAALHAGRGIGARDLITMDIGGTSCDVCIIRDGQPGVSRELRVDDQPLGVPGIEIHSIGAGGGSIASVDAGGALRVGPRSAGARPGPAAYDAGGLEPTLTDANLVLGALSPDAFLGGRRALRGDLAGAAIARDVADPLGLSVIEAAAGIRRVVEESMVSAIRMLSTERGIDPRRFVLVAGGGGGALHVAQVARALGIARVLVPHSAGTMCAFGMTVTDVRHDHVATLHQLTDHLDVPRVATVFGELEAAAADGLERAGFTPGETHLERSADARYVGQVHELTVALPNRAIGEDFAAAVANAFHDEHEHLYTYARRDLPVEVLHWRVQATGATPPPPPVPAAAVAPGPISAVGSREVSFAGHGELPTAVYEADHLRPGARIAGPAVVDGPTTTILAGPGDELTVLDDGGALIDVAAPSRRSI